MHSEAHTLLYGTNPLNRQKLDSKKLLGTRDLLTPLPGLISCTDVSSQWPLWLTPATAMLQRSLEPQSALEAVQECLRAGAPSLCSICSSFLRLLTGRLRGDLESPRPGHTEAIGYRLGSCVLPLSVNTPMDRFWLADSSCITSGGFLSNKSRL